jgi:hypothetical protein
VGLCARLEGENRASTEACCPGAVDPEIGKQHVEVSATLCPRCCGRPTRGFTVLASCA